MRFGVCLLSLLIAITALAGVASAQSACPECDADEDIPADNTYHNANVGVVEEKSRALVDMDASHGHLRDGKGFWAWLSICFDAFLGRIEEAVGLDLGARGNVDAYVSEDGIDLDATLYAGDTRLDFDESAIGHLDGETWEAMKTTKPVRERVHYPTEIPDYDGVMVDVCVFADIQVSTCG